MENIEAILRTVNQTCQEIEDYSNYIVKCGERPKPIECPYCHNKANYTPLLHPFEERTIARWLKPKDCQCKESIKQKQLEMKRLEEEAKRQREEEALKKRQQEIDRLFNMSKLGERFKKRTFDTFIVDEENNKAYETAKRFVNNFEGAKAEGYGIVFSGTCGSGKTHIACSIGIELLNKGIPVIYGTAITLLGKIKDTYSSNGKESDLLDLYSNVELLIIDDLGKENPSEWVVEKLYYIINQRYENLKPTIITSNFDLSSLADRLTVKNNKSTAEAIISRLSEMCVGVDMNFKDHRRQ